MASGAHFSNDEFHEPHLMIALVMNEIVD